MSYIDEHDLHLGDTLFITRVGYNNDIERIGVKAWSLDEAIDLIEVKLKHHPEYNNISQFEIVECKYLPSLQLYKPKCKHWIDLKRR